LSNFTEQHTLMAQSLYLSPTDDTIVAPATAPGTSAVAIIRVSGKDTFSIVNKLFKAKDLSRQATHTIHFGTLREGSTILDEVLISVFRGPNSFTKEDLIEISCHGSDYIVKRIIQALLKQGARLARPGEFTKRAFLNGRFDLAQAEAVADVIYSDSEAAHLAAMHQMRGGFSGEIRQLREKLIYFASMIELELDFGEEDVEFANRRELKKLIGDIQLVLQNLISSFDAGNAIKNGVPTVIAGKPNAGKSTLLNVLVNEEKALVSDIPGTTRDVIEDEVMIEGIRFRIIDTAGLRETTDTIEAMGVSRTRQKMKQASLIIYLFDASTTTIQELEEQIDEIKQLNIPFILAANKSDLLLPGSPVKQWPDAGQLIFISAARKQHTDELKQRMLAAVNAGKFKTGNTIITNIRHYENLRQTYEALQAVMTAIDQGLTGELLSLDIRNALYYLGEITGEITNDDLLATIFSKFCIGK
jgi:tRNA modification GTPase